MKSRFTDEELTTVAEAVAQYGTKSGAAQALGLSEAGVRRRMVEATRRKLVPNQFLGGKLPEGYYLGKVTALVGPDGSRMEWQHQLPETSHVIEMVDDLIETMKGEITPLPIVDLTHEATRPELLTLYPVVDVHLGLYAWKKEVGENYDLNIAKDQFLASVGALFSQTPNSGTAVIAVLGDFFHADNNNAQTEKSHNHLDVDGRHDKVLHLGTELILWMVDMALQKHERVILHVSRGNHDPYASKALTLALHFRYEGNPRVTVDRSPMDLWVMQWGSNMLGFTHGDNIRAEQMPGKMAAFHAAMWGDTKWRYGFSGHYHRSKKGPLSDENDGAIWEILPAFTAKDAWNYSMGHSSNRSITARTFHKDEGWKYTSNVNV